MTEPDHYTSEADTGRLVPFGPGAAAEARRLHHLASADPETDGTLTGAAHERKYALEREAATAADWSAQGLDPYVVNDEVATPATVVVHPQETAPAQPPPEAAVVEPAPDTAVPAAAETAAAPTEGNI